MYVVTCYSVDERGIFFFDLGKGNINLCYIVFSPALRCTSGYGYVTSSNEDTRNEWSHTSVPTFAFMADTQLTLLPYHTSNRRWC